MLRRDHPPLQIPRAGSEIFGLGGFLRTLVGWRSWIGRVSRDHGDFWVEAWLPTERTLRSSERVS
jgi:hypothetical protein